MAEVSIIVPVYQVEPYIRRCVDSILAQTFPDFELILVDDGSTDQSGQICDAYAKADERVKVIHQENSGAAAARNKGLSCAQGSYLCFVDADDWIEPTMIAACVSTMQTQHADLLRHGHVLELWDGARCTKKESQPAPAFAETLTKAQIAEHMEPFWDTCSNYVWNYFFKKEAIGPITFLNLKISEDHIFVLQVLERCQKMCFLSEPLYHYCMRMGSSANRWQEEGLACQLEMVRACHHFMDMFGITAERKMKIMASIILNAYSYTIYLLCFPDCKWPITEKQAKLTAVRDQLDVDSYVPYAVVAGLPPGERIKRQLICWKQEKLLLLFGPIFMKVVRKAKG